MKLAVLLSFIPTICTVYAIETPIVKINNGSISGLYIKEYCQDAYLGIPFAEPPVGELRFANPRPYSGSWGSNVREFSKYGSSCLSSTGDLRGLDQSEDCLSLNVIKPHGDVKNLPVAVWIYGGSFTEGASSRAAYNLSFIVDKATEIGKPFIAVSINYRTNGFGFINANEIGQKGWSNVGLRDQIKGVHWVHENIASFGGDPNHIIIWGESAGGLSVGKLLVSDHLGDFVKGAIMESGNPLLLTTANAGDNEKDYTALVSHFGCSKAANSVECLQKVDAKDLRNAFNLTSGILKRGYSAPYVDHDIVKESSYERLKRGEYYKVPVLIGETTDEGTAFTPTFLNTAEDVFASLTASMPSVPIPVIKKLISLYPIGDSSVETPLQPDWNTTTIVFPPTIGKAWRSAATLVGDILFSGTGRIFSRIASAQHVPVFRYRFNIPDQMISNWSPWMGAAHFQEVVYVFNNNERPFFRSDGETWNPDPRSNEISSTMSKLWASFITHLDPNVVDRNKLEVDIGHGWPLYSQSQESMVFDLNGFYLEEDDWREEQIDAIEGFALELGY